MLRCLHSATFPSSPYFSLVNLKFLGLLPLPCIATKAHQGELEAIANQPFEGIYMSLGSLMVLYQSEAFLQVLVPAWCQPLPPSTFCPFVKKIGPSSLLALLLAGPKNLGRGHVPFVKGTLATTFVKRWIRLALVAPSQLVMGAVMI